jgi:multisubunit Na+/H+ antiporter MnhE subunit
MDMLLAAGGWDNDLFLGNIAAIIAIILAFTRFVLRRLLYNPIPVAMFLSIFLDQAAGTSPAMAVFIYRGILQIHPVISAA